MFILTVAIRDGDNSKFHRVKKDLKIYCTDKEIKLFRSILDVISISIFGPEIKINIISEQQIEITEALDNVIKSSIAIKEKIDYIELGKNQYKELIQVIAPGKRSIKNYKGYNVEQSEKLNQLDIKNCNKM